MSIVVLHHTLNSCGGGERVAVHLLKLLCDFMKFNVTLACTEKTDWSRVESMLGVPIWNKPRETYFSPVKLRAFGIYQRILTSFHLWHLRKKAVLTINTHGDVLLFPADLTYMHYPVLAYMKQGYLKPYLKYLKSLFWYIYFFPYREIQEKLAIKYMKSTVLLTNSMFSAGAIEMLSGRKPIIVYPPVEVDEYVKLRDNEDREDAVIYIARFSPEKNQHLVPYIARELPHVRFYLVGSVSGAGYRYYSYVKKVCEKLGVKNVHVLPNVKHGEKLRLLSRCKVYIHLMVTEHFGIAPVEAMASGLALVVPELSGTYTDVCSFGRYGLAYRSLKIGEIVPLIEDAISRWRQLQAPIDHVYKFSVDRFYRKMRKVIETFINRSEVS